MPHLDSFILPRKPNVDKVKTFFGGEGGILGSSFIDAVPPQKHSGARVGAAGGTVVWATTRQFGPMRTARCLLGRSRRWVSTRGGLRRPRAVVPGWKSKPAQASHQRQMSSMMPGPVGKFLYGRGKTEEDLERERAEEKRRKEAYLALPPCDHNELVQGAIAEVRGSTRDVYEQYQKRKRKWLIRRFFTQEIPVFVSGVKALGPANTLKLAGGAAAVAGAGYGLFELCALVDRLIGWEALAFIACGVQWKQELLTRKLNQLIFRLKYPGGLSAEQLQRELGIADAAVAQRAFDAIVEAKESSKVDIEVAELWANPRGVLEVSLPMILDTWNYDKRGDLERFQVSVVVKSLFDAKLLKQQSGVEYVALDPKDFPPNWGDPHGENVKARPIVFTESDAKERARAIDEVTDEVLVLNGMQFEGDNMTGTLTNLHFPGTVRYLSARCGFAEIADFQNAYFTYAQQEVERFIVEGDAENKDTGEKQEPSMLTKMMFPWRTASSVPAQNKV